MTELRFPNISTVTRSQLGKSENEGDAYEVVSPCGDKAKVFTGRIGPLGECDNLFSIMILPKDGAPSPLLQISETKCQIVRVANEKRFKTVDDLNTAIADAIRVLVITDAPILIDPAPLNPDPFDRSDPALAGIDLPQKYEPIVGVFLGEPYEKARAATERWDARRQKQDKSISNMVGIEKTIVDGTILGSVDVSTDERKKNKSKLALVRTVDPKAAKRKRELWGLWGFENARPCTAKQIARFETLRKPDALARVHDQQLRLHDRDKLEAAFRLSFKLEPGARNPLLEQEIEWVYSSEASEQRPKTKGIRYFKRFFSDMEVPEAPEHPNLDGNGHITMIPSKIEGWHLRFTSSRPLLDIRLWSVALAPINLVEGNPVHMRTGCGFMALKFGDQEEFHLRPALLENSACFPETHMNELKRAIDFGLALSPERKQHYLQHLSRQEA